jgi:cysteine synthase
MFSSWVTVAWPSVGNSCVSRVVPLASAKANSLSLVLVSLEGILVGSSGAQILLAPLPPLIGML